MSIHVKVPVYIIMPNYDDGYEVVALSDIDDYMRIEHLHRVYRTNGVEYGYVKVKDVAEILKNLGHNDVEFV